MRYADYVVKKIQTEGKWDSARQSVCDFTKTDQQIAEVFVDDVQHGFNRELGPLLIGDTFWTRLGFPDILRECEFSLSEIKTAEISVLNRLIAQDSENAILSWMQTVAIDELLGIESKQFGDDRFYRVSDKLLKHQAHIEKQLYQHEKELFRLEGCIFLYDLTNTYFEGVCAQNSKAQYCKKQKEKRDDCPQVVVALVLDGAGFIRRHQIFEGKMTDSKSLSKILAGLESNFEDQDMPTIVFDRGMVTKENIELLQSIPNLKYIVMCHRNEEEQFIEAFRTGEFAEIEGRSCQKKVEIVKKSVGDITYLLCKSEGRKEKEQAMRNSREKKLEEELKSLSDQIDKGREHVRTKIEQRIGRIKERYSKVSQYYEITFSPLEFSYTVEGEKISHRLINSLSKLKKQTETESMTYPAIEKKLSVLKGKHPSDYAGINIHLKAPKLTYGTIDEIRDKSEGMEGNYLLKTNRTDLESEEIWNLYVMLTRIENAFLDLKSYLGLRPNRHHKEDRVDGHINITILAYHLLHSIEYTLREQGDHSRWVTVKRLVSTHDYSTIQLPTTTGPVINVRKPGIPEAIHVEIYNKLGVAYKNLPVRRNLA
jgi:transposase